MTEKSNECVICGADETITHHTSYNPEETAQVCRSCHGKIHRRKGFRDDLEPDMARPEDLRSNFGSGGHNVPYDDQNKKECIDCGELVLWAEAYGAIYPKEKGGHWRCFRCQGGVQNGQ